MDLKNLSSAERERLRRMCEDSAMAEDERLKAERDEAVEGRARDRRRALGGVTLLCLAWVGIGAHYVSATRADIEASSTINEPAEVVAEVPEAWGEEVLADGWDAGVDPAIAKALPAKPFEGQKRPPCTKPRQVELVGGCWLALEAKPGDDHCGEESYESGGKCYVPVRAAKRPPTSVDP